jgi:alpha-L-arabinofuranosidase
MIKYQCTCCANKQKRMGKMKKKTLKMTLCSVMSAVMLTSIIGPVQAAEDSSWKTSMKDHWSFDSLQSDQGDKTTATLHGIELVDSKDPVFGKVLRFGSGTEYLRLENYINTGKGSTSFSMWYRYDTTITGDGADKSAVLLQHEGNGRSLLTLQADGKYNTYINAQNVLSKKSVQKGDWQHVTVVFNQDKNEVTYYVNGEFDSTQSLGANKVDQKLSLRLGAHKNAGNTDPHPMRGDVDEFYVYEKALTADEAKAIYEDKAAELYNQELKKLIQEGKELAENQKLPEDNEKAKQLQNALKKAEDATTLADMKAAYAELEKAMAEYEAEFPVKLSIDTAKTVQTIEPDSIFGINHRYAFNGYGTFDSKEMKMKDEFTKLYEQAGFGSIRYPGGTISNLFNWKTTLGDKKDRKKQIHGFYNNEGQGGIEPNFGIKEIADFADQVGSEIVYVYSLGRGNAQDAADLVEFLNAKVGTNPNGGIDWAEVRAKNGHVEPYNVRYFEIGNEMQQAWGDSDGTASQGYWTTYVNGGAEKAYTEGGQAKFVQKYAVDEENWNKKASQSDGKPNLVRYLRYANQNPGKLVDGKIVEDPEYKAVNDGVRVFVGTDGNLQEWTVVTDLKNSNATDKHCVVDYSTGRITFGDGTHGMIPEKGKNIYATYTVDRQGFIDVSKAIKQTTEKINEIEKTNYKANVYTSFESHGFINRMNELGANEWYDGMTIHPYSGTVSGGTNAEAFYDDAMKKAENVGIQNVKNYVDRLPAGKVPVISEYGIFRNTESQVRSQTHALYIAKVIMEYVKLGSPYIQKHCLSDWYSAGADSLGPTQQAVIQVVKQNGADTTTGEGNFAFFSTPSARVFQMLNAGFGENVVEATFEKEPAMSNGVKTLSSLASVDKKGNMYVAIVNVDREKDQNVMLDVKGVDVSGRDIEIQRLESEAITDENTLETPNKVTVQTEKTKMPKGQIINLKKHSFAIVKILTEEQVVEKADYSKVDAAISAIPSDLSIYTEESVANLNAAKEAVIRDLDITKQAEVDKMAEAIQNAIKALQLKKADYSKVDAALGNIPKDLSVYTEESVANLNAAKDAVVRDLDITKQAEVDKMAEAIQNAIEALQLKKADYSKVDAALGNIPKDLSIYTKESVAKLEEAKEAVVRDLDITKQAEVDKMAEAIQKAIDNLKKKANVQPTPDNKPNNSVTTGDGTMILLMIMLVVVSGGTILIADKKRRRNS